MKEPYSSQSGLTGTHRAVACDVHRSRICMVGDRLDTDILFGANNGLMSILTLRYVKGLAGAMQQYRVLNGAAVAGKLASNLQYCLSYERNKKHQGSNCSFYEGRGLRRQGAYCARIKRMRVCVQRCSTRRMLAVVRDSHTSQADSILAKLKRAIKPVVDVL